jgi:C4-type Zn-finger protein
MERTKILNNGFQVLKEVGNSKIETKNGKEVKLREVKCPLCGENMRVSSWSLPNEDINIGHMSSQGEMCEVFIWTCPCCHVELKAQVKHSYRNDTMVYNLFH